MNWRSFSEASRAFVPRTPSLEVATRRIPEFLPLHNGGPRAEDAAKLIDSAVELLYMGSGKRYQGRVRETVVRESAALDPRIAAAAGSRACRGRDRGGRSGPDPREVGACAGRIPGYPVEDDGGALLRYVKADPPKDSEAQAGYAELTRQLNSIDLATLVAAALPLASELDRVAGGPLESDGRAFQTEWMTPRGRVAIGGAGPNTYRGDYLLVLDLGGDDTYEGPGAISGEQSVSVVFDAGGDDRYAARIRSRGTRRGRSRLCRCLGPGRRTGCSTPRAPAAAVLRLRGGLDGRRWR